MQNTIYIIQIVLSVILMALILIQQKGAGLGAAFGGESAVYRTKRGAEKTIFRLTIVFAILFFISALINFFVSPGL